MDSKEVKEANAMFGVPSEVMVNATATQTPAVPALVLGAESEDQRITRLRAQAAAIAGQESDAELLAKFVAEAKAAQREALLPSDLSGWPADYDWIEIYEGQDPNDQPWVPVGINGYSVRAPRGRKIVLLHVYVTESLDHAVISTATQGPNGLILRDKRRFPYQFHGKATKDEYETFMKQERALATQQLQAAA